jgi:RHS repeat-associated protein
VCVNTQRPSYYTITGVSGSSLTVEGDLTSPMVAEGGDWFRVIAPYAVDSDTGKLPENPWPDTPRASLYAGYRYMPPEVGTPSGGEVQAGANEKGRYHCFKRDYDPHTGSWTTPDPAARPWRNLQDYVAGSPIEWVDSAGLHRDSWLTDCPGDYGKCVYEALKCLREAIERAILAVHSYQASGSPIPGIDQLVASDPTSVAGRMEAAAVSDGLRRIRNAMMTNDIKWSCRCCTGSWFKPASAYNRAGKDRWGAYEYIGLCPLWFDQDRPSDCTDQVLTMIHELSHAVLDTGDYAYEGDAWWHKLSPKDRIKNVDSWGAFLRPYVTNCSCPKCGEVDRSGLGGCTGYESGGKVNKKCPEDWESDTP